MILDYDKTPYDCIQAFKGGEKEYYVKRHIDDSVNIMRGHLEPGASIGRHTHTDNCETIYIISGTGSVIIDGNEEHLTEGMAHYCPVGSTHTLRNPGPAPLDFFAVVSKA